MADLTKHLESQSFASIEEANAYLQTFVGKKIGTGTKKKKTNKDKAFDLIIEAEDASLYRGTKLAHKALELDPECVDAYNYLADHADSLENAMQLFQKGVTIGRQALGEDYFAENTGCFWGLHETRPYMRAKEGYARTLAMSERYKEAIGEYRAMLVLNPTDNQGIRFLLAPLLIRQNFLHEYDTLFKAYKDDASTSWLFNRTLYLYLRYGGVVRTVAMLRKAIDSNPHVIELLIGEKDLPDTPPEYYRMGSFEEAVIYFEESAAAWYSHEKALYWLADYWTRHLKMD
ncbi:MAG: hypothetical protein ACP5FZ_07745 [Fidelibacterota bacterium]